MSASMRRADRMVASARRSSRLYWKSQLEPSRPTRRRSRSRCPDDLRRAYSTASSLCPLGPPFGPGGTSCTVSGVLSKTPPARRTRCRTHRGRGTSARRLDPDIVRGSSWRPRGSQRAENSCWPERRGHAVLAGASLWAAAAATATGPGPLVGTRFSVNWPCRQVAPSGGCEVSPGFSWTRSAMWATSGRVRSHTVASISSVGHSSTGPASRIVPHHGAAGDEAGPLESGGELLTDHRCLRSRSGS